MNFVTDDWSAAESWKTNDKLHVEFESYIGCVFQMSVVISCDFNPYLPYTHIRWTSVDDGQTRVERQTLVGAPRRRAADYSLRVAPDVGIEAHLHSAYVAPHNSIS